MSSEEKLRFTVDSHLLLELGERLVAKRSIALTELIKNSYDADAISVRVSMENVKQPGGEIVIEDKGSGMTFQEFVGGWMTIATDLKSRHPFSPIYGRRRTGEKGVGRFACRALSEKLVLTSTAAIDGAKERITAEFDWDEFEPGQPVDRVLVPVMKEKVSPNEPTGTIIRLVDTRGRWTEADIISVQRDIYSLVSPFPIKPVKELERRDPGFHIVFRAPEYPRYQGRLSKRFLKNSWGWVQGKVSPEGRINLVLRRTRGDAKTKFNPVNPAEKIGPFRFRIYMFVYASREFLDIDLTMREASQIGREFGGVRIYMDGFRIFPYGEPGDDWLGVDADRGRRLTALPKELQEVARELERPMLLLPGNNQLFGSVFLSRATNPSIDLTITRDRLLANESFSELQNIIRLAIDWMTVQYARYQAETKEHPIRTEVQEEVKPKQVLEEVTKSVQDQSEILGSKATTSILEQLEAAKSAFEQREEKLIDEISMLHVLASTGTMIDIFNHELAALLLNLTDVVRELRGLSSELPATTRATYGTVLARLEEWNQAVKDQGEYLGVMTGIEARTRLRALILRPIIDQLEKPFKRHMKEFGIEFENNVPSNLRTPPMFSCELHSILLNLLTNSIKILKNPRRSGMAGPGRRIGVFAQVRNAFLEIDFLDTGGGVPRERWAALFKPFVSDSEPDPILGAGTGLGLKIVRDLVEYRGGTVEFVDPPTDWTTCVRIRLPTGG